MAFPNDFGGIPETPVPATTKTGLFRSTLHHEQKITPLPILTAQSHCAVNYKA
ncbi:MAG: hypothetical protein QX196_08065 [Methylococcaceae bacterium]|jgi:hypothetical protein